jgi:hypothetical protein
MQGPVGRSLAFDYTMAICSVWIAGGFFLDAWAHGHVPVESFFTPYHGVFYSGMLAGAIGVAVFALRNRARGFAWRDCIPQAYRLPLLGIPIFVVAGFGDLLWHLLLGIEEGVDALLSPTHQGLGLAIFFVASGPIRSVLANLSDSKTLTRQLPLVLGLAAWLILVHFGTAYAFDPAVGRTNAPPPTTPFDVHYFTALSIGYYKISIGVLIVIFQSTVMAGFALWTVSKIRLRFGAMTVFYLIGNIPAAAAFTNFTPLLLVTILQSLVAGLVADFLIKRYDPQPERARLFRWFAVAVPMTYIGVYLLATFAFDGMWWDWNEALGAWLWSGLVGFGLSLIATARRTA